MIFYKFFEKSLVTFLLFLAVGFSCNLWATEDLVLIENLQGALSQQVQGEDYRVWRLQWLLKPPGERCSLLKRCLELTEERREKVLGNLQEAVKNLGEIEFLNKLQNILQRQGYTQLLKIVQEGVKNLGEIGFLADLHKLLVSDSDYSKNDIQENFQEVIMQFGEDEVYNIEDLLQRQAQIKDLSGMLNHPLEELNIVPCSEDDCQAAFENGKGTVKSLKFGNKLAGLAETEGHPRLKHYKENQDTTIAIGFSENESSLFSKGITEFGIAAVFDGHGKGGKLFSNKAAEIAPLIRKYLEQLSAEELRSDRAIRLALENAFATPEEDTDPSKNESNASDSNLPTLYNLLRSDLSDEDDSGTTALVAVLINQSIYFANLGDSRAILIMQDGSGLRVTRDHSPTDRIERAGIVERGGRVFYGRINGFGLNVSRTLGDWGSPVIRRPEITKVDVAQLKPLALLLTSDGVTVAKYPDSMIAGLVHQNLIQGVVPENVAREVVRYAMARSADNISALVIRLDQ